MTLNEFQRVSVCSDKNYFFYTKLPTFVKDAPQNDNKNEQIAQCPLKNDVLDYINRNFKATLSQSFFEADKPPIDFNMGFAYNIELGQLRVNLQKGIVNKSEGILLQTRINGKPLLAKEEKLGKWLNDAHELTSDLFKQLTAGNLYETFK